MLTPVRLSAATSETAVASRLKHCGTRCLRCIAPCAVCYTDFWSSYPPAVPSKRHRAVAKETGKTSYIERFNCTLRQRVSRLVRKTLSNSCEARKSHWCNLDVHPSLQCFSPCPFILSCLGLPNIVLR